MRRGAFAADESLDERGRREAGALQDRVGRVAEVYASPSLRARETAELAGLAPELVPGLADCDFGSWTGSSLAELARRDPDGVAAWMGDPSAAPHGGESFLALIERVAAWMGEQSNKDGAALAVTHAATIRAAVVHALDAPAKALWQIDVGPVSVTELHVHEGRWRLVRLNAPA